MHTSKPLIKGQQQVNFFLLLLFEIHDDIPKWYERPCKSQKTGVSIRISYEFSPNHDEDESCHDTCRWHLLVFVCIIAIFHVHLLLVLAGGVWRSTYGKFGSFIHFKLPLISVPSTTRTHVLNQFMNSCICKSHIQN